jgi:hypothetical protein
VDRYDPIAPDSAPHRDKTILCVASYFKGNPFLEQCKREGARVVLLTLESLLQKPWAREHIDEVFALPSFNDRKALVNGVAYLARSRDFSRIAPLDDFDVETAAFLREHLRVPGMGETTARYFRDKLAMRARARDRGIAIPPFVHVLNHDRIREFFEKVPGPWLLKPRSEASAIGIKRLASAEEAWPLIHQLGDLQSNHLIEKMIPGDVYHVDSVVSERKVVFAEVHKYRKPLLEVWTGGGLFATRTLDRKDPLRERILKAYDLCVEHLGLVRGVMHTEFIVGRDDGEVYFLETAARVGGAHITDLVEQTTGINLWREWAKIELSQGESPYSIEPGRLDYGGLIVSLAKQEVPDTSGYTNPEIVWRLPTHPPNHVGFIVRSEDPTRVEALLDELEPRINHDFVAVLPPSSVAL